MNQLIVVDTNILISSALSRGAPHKLMQALYGRAHIVFSPETFAEFEACLWRPKFDAYLSPDERRALLLNAKNMAYWIETPPQRDMSPRCRDYKDEKFIHTALAADCRWLVSGDADLLTLDPLDDLRLISAYDALNLIPWLA